MIIFLFILGIFFFIILIFLIMYLSTLKIEIINLKIDTKNKIKNEYDFKISLNLFNKIKWFQIQIDKNKFRKFDDKIKLKILNKIINRKKKHIKVNKIEIIKTLQIKLDKFQFYLMFETEDAIFTSYFTAIISTIIAIVVKNTINKFNKEKYKYEITPMYGNTNFLKLNLNCIINVKMVHIINVIFIILQKRSDNKNARTSNRRAYDYSHE
jgi:hypothetical protein